MKNEETETSLVILSFENMQCKQSIIGNGYIYNASLSRGVYIYNWPMVLFHRQKQLSLNKLVMNSTCPPSLTAQRFFMTGYLHNSVCIHSEYVERRLIDLHKIGIVIYHRPLCKYQKVWELLAQFQNYWYVPPVGPDICPLPIISVYITHNSF